MALDKVLSKFTNALLVAPSVRDGDTRAHSRSDLWKTGSTAVRARVNVTVARSGLVRDQFNPDGTQSVNAHPSRVGWTPDFSTPSSGLNYP